MNGPEHVLELHHALSRLDRMERRLDSLFDRQEVLHKLNALYTQGEKIMASQAELTKQVNDLTTKVNKIGTETAKSLELIKTLQDVIANGPPVTPELQAAVDALATQLQTVDDMTPDVP